MAWIRRDLKDHGCPTLLPGRATNLPIYQPRLPRAPSNLALNTSRDGASTTSLGSQPIPAPHNSPCKELPPNIQPKSSVFQLKTIPPCPAVIYPLKEFTPFLFIGSLQVLKGCKGEIETLNQGMIWDNE